MEINDLQEGLEIWGGIECTINRVNNGYMDQLEISGFYDNPAYLKSIADVGIKTIRFPVLWEKHQPSLDTKINWTWTEGQLNYLKQNDITPIVGLLHHGSGPLFTNLLDPEFPTLFANYAHSVATQFPWVNYYTPVNEPLTTARFSGLYGLWYPHKKNDRSFLQMLLNQLKATVLAMRVIRTINPAAKLVQTEDLGHTYSTPELQYQANFENSRRDLTYDILTGKLKENHPLWNYFIQNDIDKNDLLWFLENRCDPDILGVNYYVTSERYLDHNVSKYHYSTYGSNGIHEYADLETVRKQMSEAYGPEFLLSDLWIRYKIPIAITEVHLHCSREEQMRWLQYVYDIAAKLKNEEVKIIAITVWAMMGSYGWNKLLTSPMGEYETGAFDLSAGFMRPTAIAFMIKQLIQKQQFYHPLLLTPGWWKRKSRYLHPSINIKLEEPIFIRPILIIGSSVMANLYMEYCKSRGIITKTLPTEKFLLLTPETLQQQLNLINPWAIIMAATPPEKEIENKLFNQYSTLIFQVAYVCSSNNIKLLCFADAAIFDKNKKDIYTEEDAPAMAGTNYENWPEKCLRINSNTLLIRTGELFGSGDTRNNLDNALQKLFFGEEIYINNKQPITPTYLPHLVNVSLDLLIDDVCGVCHLVNRITTTISAEDFFENVAEYLPFNKDLIVYSATENYHFLPPIKSNKFAVMPTLSQAIEAYFSSQLAYSSKYKKVSF